MNRIAYILLSLAFLASLSTPMSAQLRKNSSVFLPKKGMDMCEVGIRSGMGYNVFTSPLKAEPGLSVGLDLVYRGQFLVQKMDKNNPDAKHKERFFIGPLVGLGVSVNSLPFVMGDSVIVRPSITPNGYKVVDTLNLAGKETWTKFQVEVPLMLAATMDNVTLNLGVVGVCELLEKQSLSLTYPVSKKYIPWDEVTVEIPILPMEDRKMTEAHFHLYLSAQLGYEWKLKEKNQHRIGLQAFARYDVFQMNTHPAEGIGLWSDGKMTMTPYTDALNNNIHYLEAGVRLYYAFAVPYRISRLGLLPL